MWAATIRQPVDQWLQSLRPRKTVDWTAQGPECEPLAKLTEATFQFPALPGNQLQLIPETDAVFRSLIADIDSAQRSCQMVFYIWHMGGLADEVAEALLRAAARGVTCRVLVDAVGSRDFLRGPLAASCGRAESESSPPCRGACSVRRLSALTCACTARSP